MNHSFLPPQKSGSIPRVAVAFGDTLVWQALASVIIPGFTINRICWFTKKVLSNTALPSKAKNLAVIAAGLGSIPLIIHPIDTAVEVGMDNTLRKVYGSPHHD